MDLKSEEMRISPIPLKYTTVYSVHTYYYLKQLYTREEQCQNVPRVISMKMSPVICFPLLSITRKYFFKIFRNCEFFVSELL